MQHLAGAGYRADRGVVRGAGRQEVEVLTVAVGEAVGTEHLIEEGPVVSHGGHDSEVDIGAERDIGLQLKTTGRPTLAANAPGGSRGGDVVGRSGVDLEVPCPKGLDGLLGASGLVWVCGGEDVLARPGQRPEPRLAQGAIDRRALVRDLSRHAVAVVMLDGYTCAIRHEIPPRRKGKKKGMECWEFPG